ncbi:MAG: DUF4382 domain-containing protein [Candidatus Diapherotrites archaeon]|nr:DUF4382 domain-containing protein [Candidatus Diapherotrites archaeon]
MRLKKFLAGILVLLFLAGCAQTQEQQPPENGAPEQESPELPAVGTLIVSITDEEHYYGDFSGLNVTIEKIGLLRDDAKNELFFSGQKTFNILELAVEKKIIEQKEIDAGSFEGINLIVSKAELVKNDGEKIEIIVPSDGLLLVKEFQVLDGKTIEVVIDFDPYSVVMLEGNYLLQPALLVKLLSLQEFEQKVLLRKQQQEEREQREHKAGLEQFSYPTEAESGAEIEFRWTVKGGEEGVIPHTAVHWDLVGGHAANVEEYANASKILQGQTPQEFSVKVAAPQVEADSTLFFRFHAVVDGEHVYSDEFQIQIKAEEVAQQQLKEFEIFSDDRKFEPNEITVPEGDLVKITFNVPTSGVSFGGEDIRSTQFNTGVVKPGSSKTVEFTAPAQSFQAKSYWPGSSILKATLTVKVE